MTVRIAIGQFKELTEEKLRFAAQIGATGIQMNCPLLPGEARWDYEDVRELVEQTQAHGLAFEAIENIPRRFYDKAMLGLAGRDEQIENVQQTMRNIARAGVPILGYNFNPTGVWRTTYSAPGRGDSRVSKFDLSLVKGKPADALRAFVGGPVGGAAEVTLLDDPDTFISADAMWRNYTYFIDAVLPVAEEEGLKLALHPNDPPVDMLGGIARIFSSPADFQRAYARYADSPAWGVNLCLGTCSQMRGGAENVRQMIDFFGPKGRIFYGHFRDVQGTVPVFQECFLGEGNYDPAEMMTRLINSGFDGFLLEDHVPHMDDDTAWDHRGRAHAIGYMQGLLNMAQMATSATVGGAARPT